MNNGLLDRRAFLGVLPAGAGLLTLGGQAVTPVRVDGPQERPAAVPAGFPAQDPAKVYEVVSTSHFDLDRVRVLVTASPALAKAAWDWGFGDWETALGAASHVGRRDIAELLMTHGARPDLFTHAMLGHLEAVRAAIVAQPGIQRIPGPHGITLLKHAQNGGEPAASVAEYLSGLGDADARATSLDITEDMKKLYVGRYVFGPADDDVLHVALQSKGLLAIRRGEGSPRVLNRVEEHGFAPAGAPAVRVRFTLQRGSVLALTVHDPEPILSARRIEG